VATNFVELAPSTPATFGDNGPLNWSGYAEATGRARQRSTEAESIVYGHATVAGIPVVILAFDFRYLGGSVGGATGDRIEHAFTEARTHRRPVVSMIATGGSRMQEGMVSLTQLPRIARQCQLTSKAGIPHITVLRNPTTGGVWASMGASADVVLAEEGAQIGFAGSRVRKPADMDHPIFTAAGQFAAGGVDAVVAPEDLPSVLGTWLRLLTGDARPEPAEVPRALGATTLPETGWQAVQRARSADRPRAAAYLDDYFDLRASLRGDRCGGVDPGVLCGVGLRGGRSIAFAAQAGTPTTAAGYRSAVRLIRLAERLDLPVLTLVDTPGAATDADAESHGLGAAISEAFGAVTGATVPITTLVIGEGGSGGALALAAPDRTWITPDGYFAVTAPENAAAILKRGPSEIPELADRLRLRPQDLVELGVIAGIAGP
jgi:acetyl-CoA carboxylase beta subunit